METRSRAAYALTVSPLRCTVKGCAQPLLVTGRAAVCPRGHAFDRARGGYWNLLQPQDTKSRRPGDAERVVAARGRALAAGWGDGLARAIAAEITVLALPERAPLLDVGCGDGFFLAELARDVAIAAHGVDLSAAAIRAAARRLPSATLVVANADRALPFIDGAFAVCLSIDARRNAAELRRVLAPDGLVLVAVPAPDDLAELREVALGSAASSDRRGIVAAELAPHFHPAREIVVRHRLTLDRQTLDDILVATYRARQSVVARLAQLESLTITASHVVSLWRRREP